MRFATPTQYERDGWGESSVLIVSMGLALAIAGIVQTLVVPAAKPLVAFELFLSLLVPTGLATGGYWLASRNVSRAVRWRVAIWMSAGIILACGLSGWLVLYVMLEGGTVHGPLSLVTTLATIGGATGFVAAVHVTPQIGSSGSPDASAVTREDDAVTASPSESPNESTPAQSAGPAVAASETSEPTVPATPATSELREPVSPATPAAPEPPESPAPPTTSAEPTGAVDTSTTALSTPGPSVDTVASVPPTAETVLDILRDERARITLAVLYHDRAGDPQSVDELARVVADRTDDCVEAASVSLRHSTLPRLRAASAVDWDPYTGHVTAPKHAVFEEGVREASVLLESFEPGTR